MQNTVVEVIKNRLYFMISDKPPEQISKAFYFNIDKDLEYEGFYMDFGPLNISKIWRYTNEVQKILNQQKFKDCIFYHQTATDYRKCSNAALLMCCSQIILFKKTANEIWKLFENIKFVPFRDASFGGCTYQCTILDCLRGLQYAIKLDWFNFLKFSTTQYDHYERIQNGDLNWIIPNKFVAFSSPVSKKDDQKVAKSNNTQNQLYAPRDYVGIFKKLGINTVIRLNTATYNKEQFIQNGIKHHDLYFQDGTRPPRDIINKFLEITESNDVFAVHCKAGLGRTGTLIGCYAIKHYFFSAADFIGWIRLCRPGSIIGPQQYFLLEIERQMKLAGKKSVIWKQISNKLAQQQVQEQIKKMSVKKRRMSVAQQKIDRFGDIGQGERLVNIKKRLIKR